MTWKNLDRYFGEISSPFIIQLFKDCETPWEPLNRLSSAIEKEFEAAPPSGMLNGNRTLIKHSDGSIRDTGIFIHETTLLQTTFRDPELRIRIGQGTLVESGATIKNNTIIGENCEVRQGAYLRGNCFIGDHCTVGHTTEMKNSIFIHHVEAGHFAYIGDTIIGSFVNLGAGTKISNLEFRSLEAKQHDQFPEIKFRYDEKPVSTGISKFGAIIGDGVETGCNSVLSPFVFLEPRCWVLPNVCVSKGIYKRRSIIRDK